MKFNISSKLKSQLLFLFSFLLSILFTLPTLALPKAIVLLRHAEKPEDSNDPNLSPRGWERARALPRIFTENAELKKLGPPDFLFGAGQEKVTSAVRSIQTLQYVGEIFKLNVHQNYKRDSYLNLIHDINTNTLFDEKIVVICWQHEILTDFLNGFGIPRKIKYPKKIFDRIWLVTYDKTANDKKVIFKDMPQLLLDGDSSQ